ncbi:MAG: hypothetical protein HON62_08265, partial [Rhodospirillaceae bacterium]|nr:hypothetical protein [Rhodospirillaceae bacterium]
PNRSRTWSILRSNSCTAISTMSSTCSADSPLLLRGGGLSAEQVEDMVDIAVHELDRFYPAFQYVVWGNQSAQAAVSSIMFDTVGEA